MVRRTYRGSAMTEFAPALFIVLLGLFFPLMDLVAVGIQYQICSQLVALQAQRAASCPKKDAVSAEGPVRGQVVKAWQETGMGKFLSLQEKPVTEVTYAKIDGDKVNEDVIVKTKFLVAPFLMIPILPGVPGLGAPSEFVISSKRLLEDPMHQ